MEGTHDDGSEVHAQISGKQDSDVDTYLHVNKDLTSAKMTDITCPENVGESTFPKPELSRFWLVLVGCASFMVNFIVDGILFSFGIFLLDLLEYFGESKSKTSLVGSILLGTSMMVGPLVCFLLDHFSCRQVVLAGSILSSLSFIFGIFSPNIETLIICYGVFGGATMGLMYLTSIVVVGLYFNERRALATGIAISGSGFGTFAFSYLVDWLLKNYAWRGCVLILSGLLLQCSVCGVIFRPLLKHKRAKMRISLVWSSFWERIQNIFVNKTKGKSKIFKFSKQKGIRKFGSDDPISEMISCDAVPEIEPTLPNLSRIQRDELFCDPRLTQSYDNINSRPQITRRLFTSEDNVNYSPEERRAKIAKGYLHPIQRKDIFYSGSIMNLPEFQKSGDMDHFLSQMTDEDDGSGSMHTSSSKVTDKRYTGWSRHIRLFKEKQFVLLLISMSLWTGHATVITYLPDLAVSRGISRTNAALLISVIGITNIVGRIVAGWLANTSRVHSVVVYASSVLMAGCISVAIPLSESFALFTILSLGFGLCMGSYISLRTIVLVDILGIDKLTQSFGIIAMVQGLCFAISAPISGAIYDEMLSFSPPFFMVAGLYILSGITSLAVLYFHKQDKNKYKLINREELNIPTVINSDMYFLSLTPGTTHISS